MKPEHQPLEHLLHATKWSMQGFKAAWTYEVSFRMEVIASLFIIPLALYWGENNVEKVLLCGVWLLVLVVELLNSAVEAVVDRVGLEQHELSGRAKDLGSAAVLLCNMMFVGTWSLLLLT
ncbi:MAG: diacylglycerol kinase [Mariprofundaceae bacterium]|nr:diacylglycerol kinase [Mariprofundaceae bacterium]